MEIPILLNYLPKLPWETISYECTLFEVFSPSPKLERGLGGEVLAVTLFGDH